MAAFGEIHAQERDVVHHVDEAQRRVELDAVEGRQGAGPAHDVAAVQVAVALADTALRLPLDHERRERCVEPCRARLERGQPVLPLRRLGQRAQFGEIVERDAPHGIGSAVPGVHRRHRGGRVEAGDGGSQRGQVARRDLA